MKKLILFLMIIFIGNITALELSAGESTTITLTENYVYYSIIGNSTSLEGINITQNGFNVIITIDKYIKSDSFEITFYNEKDEVISSSGHHHKKKIIETFNNTPIQETINTINTTSPNPEIPLINIPPKILKSFPWLILVGLIVFGIFLIILVLLKRRKIELKGGKNGKKSEKSESKEKD